MKKIILTIAAVVVFYSFSNGQTAIVTDPGAYAHLAENVKASLESVNALKKQTSILTETRDALMKISNTLNEFQIIENIIQNQKYIMLQTKTTYTNLEKSQLFNPYELSNLLSGFTGVINQSANNVKYATKILKENALKMSDGERLKMLLDLETKSNSEKCKVVSMDRRCNDEIARKSLHKTFLSN